MIGTIPSLTPHFVLHIQVKMGFKTIFANSNIYLNQVLTTNILSNIQYSQIKFLTPYLFALAEQDEMWQEIWKLLPIFAQN